jgi:type I restriction enzyme R subunit
MIGRGTRLRRDLFGPGKDKRHFFVFDYCQNLEFFSQDPEVTDGSLSDSLGKKLFASRVELIAELDRQQLPSSADSFAEARPAYGDAKTDREVRSATAELLQQQVAAMNLNNFIVRPRRRAVEKYAQPQAWQSIGEEAAMELLREVAGLPSELPEEDEEAKRFDLLMLRVQLAVLRSDPSLPKLSEQVRTIAGLLEEQASIPMVKAQLALILEVQSDEFWQDITTPILERARKRLRSLIKLIEKRKRQPVYTDFEDEIGAGLGTLIELPGLGSSTDFERFRAKAQAFLRAHQDHLAIHKLRIGTPLTPSDLAELERILIESGIGGPEEIRRASTESEGLGLFVRSLIGLDREAAKRALSGFLSGRRHSASQIEFISKIIDHLTEHGIMSPERLYESPFTDVSPKGPEGLFSSSQVDELIALLTNIRKSATSVA